MKICICGSLTFTDEVMALAREIEEKGEHELLLPNSMVAGLIKDPRFDPVQSKIDTNAVNNHVDKVRECDVVLVCNYEKKEIPGYIGANTFIEIAAAHYFGKPIFALYPLPDQPYINDEIQSFNIKVIDGDITKLKRG